MSQKIKVVICSGTACFVMGASDILLLEESLPPELRDLVEIEGATCLGKCKGGEKRESPYVEINGDLMCQATLPKVLARIREIADAEYQ